MGYSNSSARTPAWPSLGRVLTLAAGTGASVGLVDLAVARKQSAPSLSLVELLPSGSTTAALVFALFLVVWFVCAKPLARRVELPTPVALAVTGFCLGVILDIGVLRGSRVVLAPETLVLSAGVGAALGLFVFLAAARWWRADEIAPLRIALGVVLAGSALVWLDNSPFGATATAAGWAVTCAVVLLAARSADPVRTAQPSALFVWLLFAAVVGAGSALAPDSVDRIPEQVTPSSEHAVKRVLLVVVDTLRADALSYASDDAPATPNIDAFAAESYRFADVRASAPWTLPSMASLLTGVSPLVHRAVGRMSALPDEIPTLAERMSAAGYRTAAIGHNFVLSPTRRLDRGFDEYLFSRPAPSIVSAGYFLRQLIAPRESTEHEDARDLNRLAGDWLEAHQGDDFFLWLHYFDPHLAYRPPAEFMPAGEPPHGLANTCEFSHLERIRGGYLEPTRAQREWIRALYDGEVRHFDAQFGVLVARLKELDLYDDTLIIFTADHGEEFWEDEGFEHGHTVRDELLAVPLLVKLPGQSRSGVIESAVSLESVAATILTLCGIEFDSEAALAATLLDADGAVVAPAEDAVLISTGTLYFQDRLALVFSGWKYVRFLGNGDEELYDLTRDPDEKRSRADLEPERMTAARRLFDEALEAAEGARERLGVHGDSETGLSAEEFSWLKDIGYAH